MTVDLLRIDRLSLEIGGKLLCSGLDLRIESQQCWGLLGRNGAGKTSLLHNIVGIRHDASGSIRVEGRELRATPRRELASRIGILFQEGMDPLPATVMETVLLGRHPHVQSLLRDDPADLEICRSVLEELELDSLARRQVDTLSGGEKQRLALAMLMAQQPRLYVLDEPSNHLDVAFQVRLLQALSTRLRQQSASMLMATHDINLAARFCDHIVLLMGDGRSVSGPRHQVLTEATLSEAYQCVIKSVHSDGVTLFYPA